MLESKGTKICIAIFAWITYYNNAGKIKETAIENKTGIVKYYDAKGKFIKEDRTSKNITTTYNNKGKIIGKNFNKK